MSTAWIIFLALATIVLALVLFVTMMRNRRDSSAADISHTERATREFREQGADNAPEGRVER